MTQRPQQNFNRSRLLPCTISVLSIFLLPANIAFAQSQATEVPAKESANTKDASAQKEANVDNSKASAQKVVITGDRGNDMDQRRQASAAKLIFGREELDRNGDSNLGEVLKRLPGISIGGRPGRGGEIRMRGMGAGYTQILINGERAPRGFNIESLPPDQVERIEVIRGTVAENSTQAIAGTVNIILREGYQQKENQLKISDAIQDGLHSPNISTTIPGKIGKMSYTLTATASSNPSKDNNTSSKFELGKNGEVLAQEDGYSQSQNRSQHFNFSPRLSWKFDDGDTLTLQSFVMHNQNKDTGYARLHQVIGNRTPQFATANWQSDSSFSMGRAFGNWITKLDGGGRLDMKFGANSFYFQSDTPRNEFNSAGALSKVLLDSISTRERGANLSAKYSISVGEGHLLAAGLETEWSRRTQTRLALVNGQPDIFNGAGDDALQASSQRLAAFIQDEWDINKQWALNLGLRWETIRLRSAATLDNAAVNNKSSVVSPIVHAVWKIPGKDRNQVRMSATHSYRSPPLANVIAVPALSNNNSATSPDRYGNPGLRPEQALGLEMTYEHFLAEGGILSANVFNRHIKQLMRRETVLQNTPLGPRWVSLPVNIGKASTHGIELEAKFRLNQMIADAPAIDLRANYSWMWSSVDGIPGPNNRLDSQAKHSANVGMDYRFPKTALTVGGSLNWTPSYILQSSPQQQANIAMKRQFDLYGMYKFSDTLQLRIAANNLFAREAKSNTSLTDFNRDITYVNIGNSPTETVWSARVEMKF